MILIAFGTNRTGAFGARADILKAAIELLARKGVRVEALSGRYKTQAVGPGPQEDYCNLVARVVVDTGPATLLTLLKRVEFQCGRRPGPRWSARTLDLDLLAYNQMVTGWNRDINTLRSGNEAASRLVLPHPRMDFRPFVLRPLIDIAPNWRHPVRGKRADQLWNAVRDRRDARTIVKIGEPGCAD